MKTITPGFKTMLDEVQKHLERQIKGSESLREYAKTVIGVSSVIVSFFATFKIENLLECKTNLISILLFSSIILFYGILMIWAIKAVKPHPIVLPINPDIKNYEYAYAGKNEFEITSVQIQLYLRAIEENKITIIKQIKSSEILGYFLGIIVILILVTSLLSLFW